MTYLEKKRHNNYNKNGSYKCHILRFGEFGKLLTNQTTVIVDITICKTTLVRAAEHTAELTQAAEHNDHKLYVVSKILDARYNEQEMFHELLVAWRGFPVGEATWEPYSVMAVDVPDMVAKFMESHEDIDAVREMRSL
jgi:Chromo (CHRromatin Organisation MOdifier) domain